jgi:protein involved in polysaccharide export with SLBB domain
MIKNNSKLKFGLRNPPRVPSRGSKLERNCLLLKRFIALVLSALIAFLPIYAQASGEYAKRVESASGEHPKGVESTAPAGDQREPALSKQSASNGPDKKKPALSGSTKLTTGEQSESNGLKGAEPAKKETGAPASRPQAEKQALGAPIPEKQGIGATDNLTEEYPPLLIGPGDLLFITVTGYERPNAGETGRVTNPNSNLPTDYLVSSSGKIFFPFVGSVKLVGLTPIEASILLMKKLSGYLRYPQVTVLVKETNTYNISVIGNVVKPAQYMIRGKPTLVSMVSLAGGPAPNADLGGVLVTRGTEKIKVDLGRLLSDRSFREEGPIVYPGDVIYVPKSPWPTLGEIAIVTSILASAAIIAVELSTMKR